ncbi:MAG: phage tail protein [Candidatus Eisenbacteria bacterium]
MRRASPLPWIFLLLAAALLAPDGAEANGLLPGQYTFRVMWDGKEMAGIDRVSGLVRRTEVVRPRSGGGPSGVMNTVGITAHEPLIIERRLSQDKEFERWANKVWMYGAGFGSEMSLGDYRKDLKIDLYDHQGKLAISYRVYNCWPSEYFVLGELDASGPSLPVEVLVIAYEGFERDWSVVPSP